MELIRDCQRGINSRRVSNLENWVAVAVAGHRHADTDVISELNPTAAGRAGPTSEQTNARRMHAAEANLSDPSSRVHSRTLTHMTDMPRFISRNTRSSHITPAVKSSRADYLRYKNI